MFLIFDLEDRIDPIICRDKAMVEDVISELDGEPFQVLTIDVDEMCRDVTADFTPDDEYEPEDLAWDRACSAGDDAYQARMEAI